MIGTREHHRSALVLLAPTSTPSLYDLRARHLRNLGRKMPSHVTVLFPFRSPVDADAVAEIERICADDDAVHRHVRRGAPVRQQRRVAAAGADGGLREVTAMVLDAFPDCAPYGGKHRQQTPHLSVGSRLTRGRRRPRRGGRPVAAAEPTASTPCR